MTLNVPDLQSRVGMTSNVQPTDATNRSRPAAQRRRTLARSRQQARVIANPNVVSRMSDQAVVLQRRDRDRHAGTVHAEHVGEEILRQVQLVGIDAVADDQQPLRQPLLDGVETVAEQVLRDLVQEKAGEGQQQIAEAFVVAKLIAQDGRRRRATRVRRSGRWPHFPWERAR